MVYRRGFFWRRKRTYMVSTTCKCSWRKSLSFTWNKISIKRIFSLHFYLTEEVINCLFLFHLLPLIRVLFEHSLLQFVVLQLFFHLRLSLLLFLLQLIQIIVLEINHAFYFFSSLIFLATVLWYYLRLIGDISLYFLLKIIWRKHIILYEEEPHIPATPMDHIHQYSHHKNPPWVNLLLLGCIIIKKTNYYFIIIR